MKALHLIKRHHDRHWVGDGFPVQSIFTYQDLAEHLSPFLLMDYAGPAHFPPTSLRRGVGAHPHRGFETVTIVYAGGVSHRDSGGGGGTIQPGDVQWMTAGAGIVHQEYHSEDFARQGGMFEIVQLWVNLPARHKWVPPAYQGIQSAQIPVVSLPEAAGTARIIAGQYADVRGAARTFTPMNLWDLRLHAGHRLALELPDGDSAAWFVLRGSLRVDGHVANAADLVVLHPTGTQCVVDILEDATVLLLSGEPLREPIVGQGPFVMNTPAEILQAQRDYQSGSFGLISS
jgi:redox-sensitive bicupin YhaK (pirin superfamily)